MIVAKKKICVLQGVCSVVISSAGCTFGLLGLFIADFILNFEAIRCAATLSSCAGVV